ncbi:hypothetical protein MOUN0_D03576 [Monosporozyma unispora]|nr:hypothetical protein C6P44_002178 [Kazachstania unispora]
MTEVNSLERNITNIIFNTSQLIVSNVNDTIGFTPHFVCEINGPYYLFFRKLLNLINPKQSRRIHLQLYALKVNNNSKEIKSHKYVKFSRETIIEFGLKDIRTPTKQPQVIEVKKFNDPSQNRILEQDTRRTFGEDDLYTFVGNEVKCDPMANFEIPFPYQLPQETFIKSPKDDSDWESDVDFGNWIAHNKSITPDSDPPFHQQTKKYCKDKVRQDFLIDCTSKSQVPQFDARKGIGDNSEDEEDNGKYLSPKYQVEDRRGTVSPSQLTRTKKITSKDTSSFIVLNYCDYKNLRRIEEVTFLLVLSILNGVLKFEKNIMESANNISPNVKIATKNRQAYTIHNVSDIINSSPCHLHRLFTKYTGITLKDYENLCLEFINSNVQQFKLIGENINLWVNSSKTPLSFHNLLDVFCRQRYNYTKVLTKDRQKQFDSWSLYLLVPGADDAVFKNKILLNPPLLPCSKINSKQKRLKQKRGGNSGPNQFRTPIGPLKSKIRTNRLDKYSVIDTTSPGTPDYQFSIEDLFAKDPHEPLDLPNSSIL